jgi:hypothetical protein
MNNQPPAWGEWLLLQSGAPDELIGDLNEAFLERPSRVWYWHQVAIGVTIAVGRRMSNHRARTLRHAVTGALVMSAVWYTAACGPKVDVASGVKVEVIESGWTEVNNDSGQTKLVPAIAFRLTNVSKASLPMLQVNAVFRRVNEDFEWGNAFRTAAGSAGLAPAASSSDLLLWSQKGYTGTEMATDMLVNSKFVDARVDLFGKYGSQGWTRLGEYPIARALVDQ